jgi:DNA-binding response OmpR family regulator
MPTITKATKWFSQRESDRTDRPAGDVLLLEDDPELLSAITNFLEENGYHIVAVTNGADGVRKVIESDFDAIVCDMIMPSFPGDMFYLATSRAKPHLCDRFIFITGDQGSPSINTFIESVNGTVLYKPFRLSALDLAIQDIRLRKIRKEIGGDLGDLGALKPEETGDRFFHGTVASVDKAAGRFILHETAQDRVRMVECVCSNPIRKRLGEFENMKVFVAGTVERSPAGKRFVVKVKRLQLDATPVL